MTETIDGATYRRHAFQLGFLTKAEADGIFASNPVRLAEGVTFQAAYQDARAARVALDRFEAGATTSLLAGLEPLANEVRQRPVYKKEYEAKGDYDFVSVPIASLLTPQFNVDLDYVGELAATLPAEIDDEAAFAFAFPAGTIAEPIVKGNTVVFTSHAPNIAVSPVPVLRRTPAGFEVIVEARSRPNFVMVARVGGRVVLHNGVHKVLALRARGRSHTFAVAHDLQQPAQLGLGQSGLSMFSDPNYIQAARPPLVADFASPVAVPVLMRATVNVYRLIAQVEEIQAPALTLPATGS
jgi:hypothetical protein